MLVQNVILNTGLNSLLKPLAASNALLNWSQVRYRKAVSFRKYKQPDFRQKLLLSVCEPLKAIDRRPQSEKCYNLTPFPPRPDHPYDVLLAKDMAADLESSALVAFFHQNQMSNIDKRLVKNEYEKEGMYLRYYNRDIARLCFANTRYAPLMHFASEYFFTVLFVPSTDKITKMIRIAKKYPEILLMGGLLDKRRLLTVKQLEAVAKMPDLDMQRAMLCHTLNIAQQGLLQSLSHHTSQLSQLLNSHANPKTEGDTEDKPQQQ